MWVVSPRITLPSASIWDIPSNRVNMDWTKVLGELNLEAPGYQECLADCRENPYVKPTKKAKAKAKAKKSSFPSLKHTA